MWLTTHPATYETLAALREEALARKFAHRALVIEVRRTRQPGRRVMPAVITLAPRGLRKLVRVRI